MAWTGYQLGLAVMLVFTGSLNTLTTKWADKMEAKSSDGIVRPFNHPFAQAMIMFFGEMLCLLTFKILYYIYNRRNDGSVDSNTFVKGNRNFKVSIFFIPALCDMVATSLMYVGLTLTYASSFQMLRGSLIAFAALLSVAFLNKSINSRQWFGIGMVISGLAIVGLSDFYLMKGSSSVNNVITGDLLIVMAQIITSVQMVCEEYFVAGQDVPPLQAVGWEGVFGFLTLGLLQIPMYFIYVGPPFSDNPRGVLEDLPDMFVQLHNNPLIIVALTGTIISIAFFNFAGISVTKELSAATRTVLDSVRTFFIWMVAVGVGWQDFSPVQIVGFLLLVLGICVYNDVYVTSLIRMISDIYNRPRRGRSEVLINEAADDYHE